MKQFFQLKSNFYFLQKLVFAIFCFILGFLLGSGILNAKAAESYNFEFQTDLIAKDDYNFSEELKEIDNRLKSMNVDYDLELTYDKTKNYYTYMDIKFYDDFGDSKFLFENNAIRYDYYNASIYDFYFNKVDRRIAITYSNLLKVIEHIDDTSYRKLSNVSSDAFYFNDDSISVILYSASYNIKNTSSNTYCFNTTTCVSQNASIPKASELLKNKVYTENLRIDTQDIDRIEYTFQLKNNSPLHEFNFSTTWYSSIARLNLFSPPYLEYQKNGISYKLPLDENKTSTLDEVMYYDTQMNPFQDIESLKFIVDFNNINTLTNESEVFIHFDSSLDFTRKIIYKTDTESSSQYYTEIDWTNNYGIYLIPKVVQNEVDQEIYSNIMYQGNSLKINLYDSVDTSKEPVKSYEDDYNINKIWGNFNYLFRFNNKNQLLFFTNKNYLTDIEPTKIRYDTRYFVHALCSSKYECEIIINPNTGEEIKPTPPLDIEKNKSIFDHFYEIFDKDNPLFSKIKEVWQEFSKSKIYNYFLLLIIGTLIVILINALNR